MKTMALINYILSIAFTLCYLYQFLYILVPIFKKSKPALTAAAMRRFGVLISARNESSVIGNLIQSIDDQKYPRELVTIFVVADNCTDDTARVAREAGAVVFERFNTVEVGKGYALNFLLDRISEDYPGDAFDGFFVFDADNLLDEHYIAEMNKTFSQGHRIITGYRNSKNYDDNWISAAYSLWFIRESKFLNNSRMLLGTSCSVSGTGFLVHRDIIERNNGWKFHLLTEDVEFSVHCILSGERIAYCKNAILYDEQPTDFRQSWYQRLRWSKGCLQVFQKYGGALLKSVFAQGGFSCYDMLMVVTPTIIMTVINLLFNVVGLIFGSVLVFNILNFAQSVFTTIVNAYLALFALGLITLVSEWKQIHGRPLRKVAFLFSFPIFQLIYIPITLAAVFQKVEWKPIIHKEVKTLADVRGEVRKAG